MFSTARLFEKHFMTGYGTVFKITTSGTLTTLHSFCVGLGNSSRAAQ
jgi:hypothetical protein